MNKILLLSFLLTKTLFTTENHTVTYQIGATLFNTITVPPEESSPQELRAFIKSLKTNLPYNSKNPDLPLACLQPDCHYDKAHEKGFASFAALQVHISHKSDCGGSKKRHPFKCPLCNKGNTTYITGIWTHCIKYHWKELKLSKPLEQKKIATKRGPYKKQKKGEQHFVASPIFVNGQKERGLTDPTSLETEINSPLLPQNLSDDLEQLLFSEFDNFEAIFECVHGLSVPPLFDLPPVQP